MESDNRKSRLTLMLKAISATHEDAKMKGLRQGHGGQSSLKCPVCAAGEITYSVAGVNGHIWGSCSTEGCAKWME